MLLTLRILVALTALSILVQATTMGIYLSGQDGMLAVHFTGAMVAATLTLIQAVVAIVYVVRRGGPWLLAISACVMFVAVMIQMVAGFAHNTPLHLPLGVLLFGSAIWLLTWAKSAPAAAAPASGDKAADQEVAA